VERRLCPKCSALRRTGSEMVPVRQHRGDGRGDERGMQEGLEGTRPLGVDLVRAMRRFVQLDAQLSGKGLARIR
jgi:hypothetical protein